MGRKKKDSSLSAIHEEILERLGELVEELSKVDYLEVLEEIQNSIEGKIDIVKGEIEDDEDYDEDE